MIILISGKQGSGKSSTCEQLAHRLTMHYGNFEGEVKRLRFAEPLYQMHDACRDILKKFGITQYNYDKVDGPLLQMIGTEWGRDMIYENVWADCGRNQAVQWIDGQRTGKFPWFVLFEDLRFINEFHIMETTGFPVLRVRLEAPEEVRKLRAAKWRENTNHKSEIGLDEYAAQDKFELRINTDACSLQDTVKMIEKAVLEKLGWTYRNSSRPLGSETSAETSPPRS